MSESYDRVAKAMAEAVNGGRVHNRDYKQNLQNEHHALQQLIFDEVFKPGIIALASQSYCDARNERAVATCRDICEAMDWDYS
jgi:hypothetical protein